ncbi:MAG: type 2 isopentenyl-diphosphate Delta-isomerase, partial [Polyangiaceae bacterium]|nr:type 2 isopentenyl-diphosphate Delta-isomerase [Polyangiaceae bacterium]
GHERAREINRALARIAEERGYGFGLGSQRAMHRDGAVASTYEVRDVAPTLLLLGNIGVVQAASMSTDEVESLVAKVGADGLCLHMSPAMELVQPGGDRDFRGGLDTFARLVGELSVPIVAKETGSGISSETAARLASVGVTHVDVSAAGGTSWVGVETMRAEGTAKTIGEDLWDWGIPTAASVAYCASQGLVTIATGGIRSGLDVARAIALGASAAGIARTVYQAWVSDGERGVINYLDAVERELAAVMLLTGSGTLRDLKSAPRVITGELKDWLAASRKAV